MPDIFPVTEDVDLHLLFNAFLQNACYSLVSVMVSEKQALKYMKSIAHDHRSDEGLTLETSAFLLFTVANLRFQPSC